MSRVNRELAKSRSRLAGLTTAARHDPRLTTAPARAAFLARFEREVDASDPNGQLDPAERARRIEYLRRLYFARLAYRSQVARAERRAERLRTMRPWLAVADTQGHKENGDER
jgi:hypothetical protein